MQTGEATSHVLLLTTPPAGGPPRLFAKSDIDGDRLTVAHDDDGNHVAWSMAFDLRKEFVYLQRLLTVHSDNQIGSAAVLPFESNKAALSSPTSRATQ